MLTRPIFLSAFSRGGSNILWNILASHPKIIHPSRETHEIFFGKQPSHARLRHLLYDIQKFSPYVSVRNIQGQRFVSVGRLSPDTYRPRELSPVMRKAIDHSFSRNWIAGHERSPGIPYSDDAEGLRVAFKSINGTLWLNPIFAEMYPDAVFINLLRDGLSLCESRMRRGTFTSAAKFGVIYSLMVEEMKRQAATLPNCHVIRFEDFLSDPEVVMAQVFNIVGEDIDSVTHLRLRDKGRYIKTDHAGGDYVAGSGGHAWVDRSRVFDHVEPKISELQRSRLTPEVRDSFLSTGANALTMAGYDI